MLTVTSGAFTAQTGVHVCTKHTGKMKHLWSISTSPRNKLCEERSKCKGSICEDCYSRDMNEYYPDLAACLERNSEILKNRILTEEEMPKLGNKLGLFRFEAFGDSTSEIQVVNYFNITNANPKEHCALWTKNPWIVDNAMKHYNLTKPKNLKIVGSSVFKNKPMIDYYRKYKFIDYIFTVYDEEFIKKHNIEINCGGRSCESCKKCYLGTHDGYEIREKLK